MIPATAPLIGFSREIIWKIGQIMLPVKIGDVEHFTPTWMNFVVVRSPSPYNGIIGILTLWSNKTIPLECTMVSEPEARPSDIIQAAEERIKVAIHPEHPEKIIAIGSTLTEEGRKALLRQKKRSQTPERNKTIQEEVEKPVDADIMKEVHYHSWLSNPVMVKKHDDSWRMCVDFNDLNKACPKDGYSLLEIDWKVESLCGYPFKCFLDAYKGHHQIKMANEDEEKTTFITSQRVFCYFKMPFSLKNARATYQRLVDKTFQKQIGINLEVYVDDLVIKSHTEHEIIRDMEETFKTLREINMKLNPKKCTFGIEEGTFMCYKVNTEGIMVCPDKVGAVLNLPSLKCLKDVQKLNGKLASLNIFLSKSVEKSLSFFKTLKKCTKKSDFQWTAKAEAVFKEMKKFIAKLPTLTAPMEKEELIVYLAAVQEAVSAFLMTEKEAKQMPVYFVSRALQDHPIKQIQSRPEVAERMQKWSIELGEYDIQYIPRTSVKGQILADFIMERPEDDSLDTPMEAEEELPDPWTLFTNGLSCIDGFRAGLILTNIEGAEFT
ncbi:reverse transcriptase domain-containing protein [Tanacetum coccineum]